MGAGKGLSFTLARVCYPADGETLALAMIASDAMPGVLTFEAWVVFDPAALRWRFSHINHALEGSPQDVFPQP